MTRIERRARTWLATLAVRVLGPGDPDVALRNRVAMLEHDTARRERQHAAELAELAQTHAAQVLEMERQRDLALGFAQRTSDNFDELAKLLAASRAAAEAVDTRTDEEREAFAARCS